MASADDQYSGAGWSGWSGTSSAWSPAVDVYETADACAITAEVAGARDFQIELAADRRTVSLRGRRTCRPALFALTDLVAGPTGADVSTTNGPRVVCHQLEIATGPFERRVTLPCAVDAEAASARCDDGFLLVVLPKVRSRGPVRVRVSAAAPSAPTAPTAPGGATRGPRGNER
jgi:HSP20 family protein